MARHAADVASVKGLEGLSLGRLAADLGLSKSGVQGLFATRENLEIAAVDAAREAFIESVIDPAMSAPPGLARLHALFEQWIVYVTKPLFPGGCFRAANLPHVHCRPEPVREALLRDGKDWLNTIAQELRIAIQQREIAELNVDQTIFEIDAVLLAANTAVRLGDPSAIDKVKSVLARILVPPPDALNHYRGSMGGVMGA